MKVGSIYSTGDYSIFKKLNGNRSVLQNRKCIIMQSIIERGWIRNPIVVNEKMEIIDGQGRFEALRELGMPIEYVVAFGATIADCIALNIKQTNWKNQDYVQCYADMGNENYIKVLALYGAYPNLADTAINLMAGMSNTDGSGVAKEIREGILKITDEDSLKDRLAFADRCMAIIGGGNGRNRVWVSALKFIFFSAEIDTAKFEERLEKNRAFLTPCANLKQVLECFEKIYNYAAKSKRIYFIPEWDHYLEERRHRRDAQ